MKILFFGDVVGKAGRIALLARLDELKERFQADAVVANGENTARGVGITPSIADAMFLGGVDVITTGNHVWRQREIYSYIDEQRRIIRPYNFLPANPGRGLVVIETPLGRLGVLNLSGSLYLDPARSPFEVVDEAVDELEGISHIIVDMHAEATSEKVAMGWYLDGRVSAVVGTHTHVRTADPRILPEGTAYITDVGMCGPRNSVIGVDKHRVIERFVTQMPIRFDVAEGDTWLEGVAVETDEGGRALSIEPFEVPGGSD